MDLDRLFKKIQQALTSKRTDPSTLKEVNSSSRLVIYRRSYQRNLLKALNETFACCVSITGPSFFETMAKQYITITPSHSANLFCYGGDFADFIQHYPAAQALPYLPDMARLEWARLSTLHGVESRIALAQLAKVKPELHSRLRFSLPAHATLLTSAYPIDKIWLRCQKHYHGPDTIDLGQGGVRLLIWRKNCQILHDLLSEKQAFLLHLFANGLHLHEVCEQASQQQTPVAEYLAEFINQGWLARFALHESHYNIIKPLRSQSS